MPFHLQRRKYSLLVGMSFPASLGLIGQEEGARVRCYDNARVCWPRQEDSLLLTSRDVTMTPPGLLCAFKDCRFSLVYHSVTGSASLHDLRFRTEISHHVRLDGRHVRSLANDGHKCGSS